MKLNGIFGTGSGKVGNAVFATSAGQQIVRPYQSKVTNPNTDAQVAQRAKFKLLSQLAAAMASVIVIPKEGLVSSRNRFVQLNSHLAIFDNGQASVILADIQLTKSSRPMSTFEMAYDSQAKKITGDLHEEVFGQYSKIRYCLFKKTEDDKLLLVGSQVINTSKTEHPCGNFEFSNISSGEFVCYAYGMTPITGTASSTYSDYETTEGADNAVLDTNTAISARNYTFSKTVEAEITVD